MTKSELTKKISEQVHLLENDIERCIKTITQKIIHHLSQGGRVEIRNFGVFDLRHRSARTAHNPKTKEKFITQPKCFVCFKAGKSIKKRINQTGKR